LGHFVFVFVFGELFWLPVGLASLGMRRERRAPTDETDADNQRRGIRKGSSRAHIFVLRKSAGINIDQHPQTGEYHIGRPLQCSAEGNQGRGIYSTTTLLSLLSPIVRLLEKKKGKLLIIVSF